MSSFSSNNEPILIKPTQIPNASPDQLSAILQRLLECPKELLPDLSAQCSTAIADLPEDTRPESYEGLLDVARFCVEDEPGWDSQRRAKFLGGHPRIGAALHASTEQLSEESRNEQLKGGQADPATLERLARLNAIYEARYPGLRFVTYVAGRSRAVVADELANLLGSQLAELKLASELASDQIQLEGTPEWDSELERGSDALWEIATNRAEKLTGQLEDDQTTEVKTNQEGVDKTTNQTLPSPVTVMETTAKSDNQPNPSSSSLSQPNVSSSSSSLSSSSLPPPSSPKQVEAVGQDVPFLSLATFRMLVLSSPVLESFFESDLTPSFYLEPVERSQSGGAFAWHSAPNLPGAPKVVPGASKDNHGGNWFINEASYSRDVTTGARGKVVGFLGGLLGEEGKAKMTQLADQVGQRLQTHTVTGPKPSFGRKETLDGKKMDTQELREKEAEEQRKAIQEKKNYLGNRLANALRASSLRDERGRTVEKKISSKRITSLRGTDLAISGPMAAAQSLRAAQEALVLQRPAFIIDEVGVNGEEEEEDPDPNQEDVLHIDSHTGHQEEIQGLLKGKEAQIAKDLRSAPAQ